MAAAADAARGQPTDVFPEYRRPLFTALMRAAFGGGVSLERAHMAEAAAGLALVLLGAGAAGAAFGRRAAVIAAALLAVGFVPVAIARTTLVYGPLIAALAGAAWLHAAALRRESPALGALAFLALLAAALGLQTTAIVAAPALALGHVAAAARPGRAALAAIGAIAAAGVLALLLEPEHVDITILKARTYIGSAGPLDLVKRVLRAPFASGLAERAPLILGLGGVGALLAFDRGATRAERALAASLAAWLTLWIGVFGAFEYPYYGAAPATPIRHFAGVLVPAALLAAGLLARLSTVGIDAAPPRALTLAGTAVLAYVVLGTAISVAAAALLPEGAPLPSWIAPLVSFPALALVSLSIGAAVAALTSRGIAIGPAPRLAAALLAAGLALDAARLAPVLAYPTYSLAAANRRVAALLGPGARVYGPWAHALTYDAPSVTRHLPPAHGPAVMERSRAMTHLALDATWSAIFEEEYRARGTPLTPLLRLEVRGYPVVLYRFAWAEALGYRPTAAEEEARASYGRAP
jgi:hypothetical protein